MKHYLLSIFILMLISSFNIYYLYLYGSLLVPILVYNHRGNGYR